MNTWIEETDEQRVSRLLGTLTRSEVYSALTRLAVSESQDVQDIASVLATIYSLLTRGQQQ